MDTMNENFWGVKNYDDWMEETEEKCPECGYPAPKRQVNALEMCGRCWHEKTGGISIPDDEKSVVGEMFDEAEG